MTPTERWFAYAALIGLMVLAERRIITTAVARAEARYWARKRTR